MRVATSSYMSGLLENGVGASDMAVIWSYGWKMILLSVTACVCAVTVGFLSSIIGSEDFPEICVLTYFRR